MKSEKNQIDKNHLFFLKENKFPLILNIENTTSDGTEFLSSTKVYSLRPSDFYTLSFSGCPIQFYTFQNFPKILKFFNIKIPPTHYFHLLFQIYHLNISRSHHFTYFSFFFPLLYITLYPFFSLRVQHKRIYLTGTEGVPSNRRVSKYSRTFRRYGI